MRKRILFIEDDSVLNRGICTGLEREGYEMKAGFSIADAKNMLAKETMECDMIGGLDAGADDYIVKPVSLRVLTARIQALLRRTSNRENMYRMGPFEFVFEEASFRKHGILLQLSIREQKLLAYLVAHANLVLSRDKILAHLWMDDPDSVEENAVAVVIRRLREKLEDDPARPVYIRNVYGAGYMWSEEKK